MEELIKHLEVKVNALIQQCESLKETNLLLQQSQSLLIHENRLLQAKHKDAIAQIEMMVSRLKLIENPQ